MTITLYGIPNCDTVKKARTWLASEGVEYAFHDFKKQGVPPDRLDHWLATAGWQKLLNRQGTTWRKLEQPYPVEADNGQQQQQYQPQYQQQQYPQAGGSPWDNVVPEPGVVVGAGGPPPVYQPAPVYAAPVYVQPAYTYPYAQPYVYPPVGISLNLGYSRGWGGGYYGRGYGGYRGYGYRGYGGYHGGWHR
jgi:Spx/MgsR family transcriptional regulator